LWLAIAAIDPGVAGLLTAVGTILGLVVKTLIDWRKDRAAAKAEAAKDSQLVRKETLANYLEGYQRLVDDQAQENKRLLERIQILERQVSDLLREVHLLKSRRRREKRGKAT
jgi:hypothetical protein